MAATVIKTLHSLISELATRSSIIAKLGLTATTPDRAIEDEILIFANEPAELDRVARAVDHLVGECGFTTSQISKVMGDLFSEANFYGQVCEFGVYDWLQRHSVEFDAQVSLNGTDVLNPNGSDLDGRFSANGVLFDIKAMGFQAHVKAQFQKKLQRLVSAGMVTIDGRDDLSVKEIETRAFRQVKSLAADLNKDGIARIKELDWIVRVNKGNVAIAEGTLNPYRMAAENRHYPFKTARQFARHEPFILIFGFGHRFNQLLAINFDNSTLVALRALSRRAFMQATEDATPVSKFDSKADSIPLSEACKLLSGMIFLNFNNDHAWCFLNPRAKHRLTKSHVEQIFDFMLPRELYFDDFMDDDY